MKLVTILALASAVSIGLGASPTLAGAQSSPVAAVPDGRTTTPASMDGGSSYAPEAVNAVFTSDSPRMDFGEEARIYKANILGSDDRLLLLDLMRKKEPTEEERALLAVALQTGSIDCGGRDIVGVLIVLPNGRDAIVVGAHPFVDQETGHARCDLTKLALMPNVALNDHDTPGKYSEISLTGLVETDGSMPMNWENVAGRRFIPVEKDFLIFPLSRKVSDDILPNGSRRGSMRLAASVGRGDRPTYLIGRTNDFYKRSHTHYQLCPATTYAEAIYHECDTIETSSSSALMQYVRGEMVLVGVHSGNPDGTSPDWQPMPEQIHKRNYGAPVRAIREYLNEVFLR